MKDLNYGLKQICKRNRDGSYGTQATRERILTLIANQLQEMGFRFMTVQSLKPKHVEALLGRWTAEGATAGTIKNRMAELRWWAEKVGKQNVMRRTNEDYGIADRQLVSSANKARELTPADLSKVADPYTRASLSLQAAFGLRREESIKIQPVWSDRGDRLVLKESWTKGGRAREIPIRTDEQRLALAEAKQVAGRGSLIPADVSYVHQLRRYEDQCAKAGIHRTHGHRHAYAQARYLELTGRRAPAAGGLRSHELTADQKKEDREARLIISAELGHEREQVTAVYLGR